MSFGDKHLDESYDRWVTQTPEEYFGYDEDDEEEDDKPKRRRKKDETRSD